MELTADQIASVAHEANRAYCAALGDHSQYLWGSAPEWVRESAIAGVKEALAHPEATPESMHAAWSKAKIDAGWKHGPLKAPERKEHPCLVSYEDLPDDQKLKDVLFLSIVRALSGQMHVRTHGTLLNASLPESTFPPKVETDFDEGVDAVKPIHHKRGRGK